MSDKSTVDSSSVSENKSSLVVLDSFQRDNFIEWDENNRPRYTRYIKSRFAIDARFTEGFFDHQSGESLLFSDSTLGSLERKAAQQKLDAARERHRLQRRREVVEKVREKHELLRTKEKRRKLKERRQRRQLKKAIVTIQRKVREFLAVKWEQERDRNRKIAAQILIAEAYRRAKSRDVMKKRLVHYHEQAKLFRAGMELEGVFRRWIDRKRAREELQRLQKEREQEKTDFMESIRHDAAVCIQKLIRGYLVRKHMGDIYATKRMPFLLQEGYEEDGEPFFITEGGHEDCASQQRIEQQQSVPTMCDDPEFQLQSSSYPRTSEVGTSSDLLPREYMGPNSTTNASEAEGTGITPGAPSQSDSLSQFPHVHSEGS